MGSHPNHDSTESVFQETPAMIDQETKKIYLSTLENARKSNSTIPIGNRYPWHCKAGVSQLLKCALDRRELGHDCTVRLLTGTFTQGVYRAIRDEIEAFVSAGGKMNVLIWGEEKEADLANKISAVTVRCSGTNAGAEQLNHFMLVDDDAYRYEAPHPEYTAEQFSDVFPPIPARICFNDRKGGQQLLRFFEDLWAVAPGS